MDEIEQIKKIAIDAGWNTLLKDSPEYQVFSLADSFKAKEDVKEEVKDLDEPKKEVKVSKPKKRSKK